MRKYVSLLLALLLVICLAGCQAEESAKPSETTASETEPTTGETEPVVGEMLHNELAKVVAKNLGVPDGLAFTYEIGERFYWDSGEIWLRTVYIRTEDGGGGRADVDPTDGRLIKSILNYEKPE